MSTAQTAATYDPAPDWYYSQAIAYCKATGCFLRLDRANIRLPDGCPCGKARGANHGVVPTATCCCTICDPGRTGSTRYPVQT